MQSAEKQAKELREKRGNALLDNLNSRYVSVSMFPSLYEEIAACIYGLTFLPLKSGKRKLRTYGLHLRLASRVLFMQPTKNCIPLRFYHCFLILIGIFLTFLFSYSYNLFLYMLSLLCFLLCLECGIEMHLIYSWNCAWAFM